MIIETKLWSHECQPWRANEHDAGVDLISRGEVIVKRGIPTPISTGVAVNIPQGYVGLVFSRSGHGKKGLSLANSVGVIDSGYQGEIIVWLLNSMDETYIVKPNERIAQLVVIKCEYPQFQIVNEFSTETARGENGFGSTGL